MHYTITLRSGAVVSFDADHVVEVGSCLIYSLKGKETAMVTKDEIAARIPYPLTDEASKRKAGFSSN
jgi:hypothetical protein